MTPKKRLLVVVVMLILGTLLLHRLNHRVAILSEENDITVKLYSHIWPFHGGNSYCCILYKNKPICCDIAYIGSGPKYLLSPDASLIVYGFHDDTGEVKYGIYNTKSGNTQKSQKETHLVLLNNARWNENELILSNENEQHILNLKTGELRIEHQYNPDVNNVSHPQEIKRKFIKLRHGF
jgi:hypothetical protein